MENIRVGLDDLIEVIQGSVVEVDKGESVVGFLMDMGILLEVFQNRRFKTR